MEITPKTLRPLFEHYPALRDTLPHAMLGDLPTPIARMEHIEQALGPDGPALYVKRDDLSGKLYGGNKVRKLEFLLGRALHDGRKAVLTFGAAGSNHALATALYARQLGLGCISMLVPQPNAHSVRRNLLMGYRAGAELHAAANMGQATYRTLWQIAKHWAAQGRLPYLIPPGGSSPVGLLGFVNAGFELKAQIAAGEIPEPDCVYAASGTMGTVVGLLLGFQLAGLRTKMVAVRVTAPQFSSVQKAAKLFGATNRLLHKADPSIPLVPFPEPSFEFRHEFYGEQYAMYTDEAVAAVRQVRDLEGVKLEGTYTGKTFAAVSADTRAGRLKGKTVLFWDTYNSTDFSAEIADLDYHVLPKPFHRYFEQDVQPLDRDSAH